MRRLFQTNNWGISVCLLDGVDNACTEMSKNLVQVDLDRVRFLGDCPFPARRWTIA